MAILWQSSGVPFIDPNGDPYSGAKAYFYDAGTTTPLITYQDGLEGVAHDHPVVADASGVFPAVFLTPDTYKVRIVSADEADVIFAADGVVPPQPANYVPPDAGATDPNLLFSTGMLIPRYGTGTLAGWVRAAGRTLGNAASGATERANADAQALFVHLWSNDATLAVSGGRGSTAVGDFSANKTIVIPDLRSRALAGLATMGNTNIGLIADALVDGGETADTLGATAGASTHLLTSAEMPVHTHTVSGSTSSDGAHAHTVSGQSTTGPNGTLVAGAAGSSFTQSTSLNGVHAHSVTGTAASTGGGGAHANIQPSMFATYYIKL